jgi:hypothetical protein
MSNDYRTHNNYEFKRCVSAFGVVLVPASDITPILKNIDNHDAQNEINSWARARECLRERDIVYHTAHNPLSSKMLIFCLTTTNQEQCTHRTHSGTLNLSSDLAILLESKLNMQDCNNFDSVIFNVY